MAASGKKNKKKWKPIAINEVIDSTPARKPVANWADEVDKELLDADSYEIKTEKLVLPTAPRASRGTTIDESKIPLNAPFQAYLSNIPYDLTEAELINFFQKLKVKQVRIPRDEKGGNRAKGFCYIEFEDRASLVSALSLNENTLKNRAIRIELTTNVDSGGRGGGRGGRGNRDGGRSDMGGGGSDRTAGNWRTGPRMDDFDDRGGGGSGYDRGGYNNRRDFGGGGGGGGFSRGYEDRGSFFRDDRGMDRDRFSRDDRRDGMRDDHRSGGGFNQGGFDRGDRGGFGRDRDDRGFSHDRDDRGFNRDRDDRGFSSFSDRDRGFSRRDEDRYRDDRGGHWRDESNYNRMDDRRDRDRYSNRRSDPPPPADKGGATEVRTRTKLKLLPPSKSPPAKGEAETVAPASIFGGARPVDTAAREREIEERLMRGDDPPDMRSKSTSGSGSGGGSSQKDVQVERRTEPAPPPKENAWSRKTSNTGVVNNGRSSPEEVRQSGGGGQTSDGDDKNESSRSWGRGESRRQQEPKRIEESRSRGPQHKGGAGGNTLSEKSRVKDEKQISKHREGRKEIDDISRMPKIQESKVPSKRTFYRNRNR